MLGSNQVPLTYQVPVPGTLTALTATGVFDGSGAAAFLPCLSFYDSDGNLISRATAPEVAAGASAEVSWFPRVAQAATAATGAGVIAAQVTQPAHTYVAGSDHVVVFDASTFTTNDPSTFTMPSGTPMNIAHGGLIMTGLICQFGPDGGIPYSGAFELSTEILDANNFPVDALTNPNYYTPELYGTDPGDEYNPNGYALFNCDDSTFTPPYTLKATITNLTGITTTGTGLVVAILTPTGLT